MTTRLTFPASMFSVVCQRCGSTLRKSADSCPNCGADRAAAFGEGRARTRGAEQTKERGGLFKPAGAAAAGAAAGPALAAAAPVAGAVPPSVARTPEPVAPASSNAASGAASPPLSNSPPGSLEADPDVLPDSEGWNRRKTMIASVCALALLAGGTAYLLHDGSADDEDAPPSTQHSASGTIDAKPGGRTQTGALPATTTAPSVSAAIERRPSADDRPMSIGDTVLAARRAMEQHDLSAARNRLKSIATAQQSRPDVQRLKDDLAQRELERDAALQLARACEKTSAWACVQQNAGEALALDGSNTESQAMLERVITHAGWLAGTPPLAKKKAAPDNAGAVPPAATVAVQAATPPAHVAAATPAPAQTPPTATPQKQAVAAARTPAAPPAETRASPTPSPARESRRSSSYGRSAPSSAMADVTVIPAPAISPPLLPTTPATSSSTATRNTPTTAASPTAAHGTGTTATATATAEHATPATTATTRSTVPTTTATATTTAPSAAPSYAAPTPVPAARVATAIPSSAAVVTTTAPANTTTTTAPTPVPIAATATRTAAVTGNTPGSTGATETRPAPRAPLPDGESADELERAIKQFGWSGGDSMPKPSR
ncbi:MULTISPECIES: zinc ribbon domain-containing protein [unclassified Caballeronia]|uniref:zinc ribbon domain-containing protein n=1 Tax=unclassified Caballeronia TaxID=2646786 RepID=UPI002861CBE5|nr:MULTISPECIES: zinc ribbon domain-containing protein [unclassified Caballeronia]MDR5753702.1 zinc ribbon domain-containing protein [Caballeronia sp. LZ024]MDR5840081.1 zinc ribbon domain-containing protein [Caballeronia sp. LZ031]